LKIEFKFQTSFKKLRKLTLNAKNNISEEEGKIILSEWPAFLNSLEVLSLHITTDFSEGGVVTHKFISNFIKTSKSIYKLKIFGLYFSLGNLAIDKLWSDCMLNNTSIR